MTILTIHISEVTAVLTGMYPECSFTGLLIARAKNSIEIINKCYGIMEFSTKDIEKIEY